MTEEILGQKNHKKSKQWFDKECTDNSKARNQA